ncbi:MAG: phosphatase PAP2 family protein [Ignavibacteriae bacterium]|nr:MAG: phosphatase PAP2 family protein [Ignavibacteriota bacterium]
MNISQEFALRFHTAAIALILTLISSQTIFAQETTLVATDTSRSSQTWTYVGAGSAVLITAVLIHYDQEIYDHLYAWRKRYRPADKTSPVITNMGDGTFSIGLFGGFAGYGLIFNDKKAVEVGKIGLESFLLTGITVQIFKNLCGRERPSASTRPGGFWHGPFSYLREPKGGKGIASFDAFPSGHTTTVFAAATTISDFYTEPWVSYVSYSLASLTAISRVTQSTHWMSDCFVGAIIGYYGTKLVEHLNYGNSSFTLQPKADEYQYGLTLSVKF